MMKQRMLAAVVAMVSVGQLQAGEALEKSGKTDVVILTGSNNHDWKTTTPALEKILEESGRFNVDVVADPKLLTKDRLAGYDVLLSNWNAFGKGKAGPWSEVLKTAYADFVRNGGGHVVVHAGSSSFYDWDDYQAMGVAAWKGKTGHKRVHEFEVRMADDVHPITRGLKSFKTTDELWFHPFVQPDAKVLAESFSQTTGKWEPTAVVSQFGKGRCFTLLLGHDVATMQSDGFQTLLVRGTEWAKSERDAAGVYPGADERTPSYSQYFSWINNTNEGSTEEQTLVNLDFFQWLRDEFGMVLDIYVISAGAIDKAGRYGRMDSEEFRRQFPNGFGPIYQKAKAMETRLGTWGGPDGFGDTPEEEQARIDMMVELCRDYEFILLKFDAVVGGLRPEKQDAFVRMMTECRKHSPDLILLNHRLKLGKGLPHATTELLGGAETYIDVHMANRGTAPHHRAGAISREIVPDLVRLTEDHGVCISSCLDYWEDDLVLQAFNRNLILAPQLYGNPWLLRDDEFPKLARIFNLARKYREIMVDGMVLPEERYGEKAVSRGDDRTRLLTLRNLGWSPIVCRVKLDEEIGLSAGTEVELRQYHPTERIIGTFRKGEVVEVEVLPFRACLLQATSKATELGIKGCDYEIVRDVPGKPVLVKLLAMPGETRQIALVAGGRKFSSARIAGGSVDGLLAGKSRVVSFGGAPLKEEFHRRLGDLAPCAVPADAEALYESTCFAADNNALELRSLQRSGPSRIPQVQKAREALLQQPLFVDRGLWDRNLFDGDDKTAFYVARRVGIVPLERGSLRIDLGEETSLDKLVVRIGSEHALQPFKYDETIRAQYSSDLKIWTPVRLRADKEIVLPLDPEKKIRYVRFDGTPDKVLEVEGFIDGKMVDRSNWRASNLFARYSRNPSKKAWQHSFRLNEIPKGSCLAVALDGEHGVEGAYAAIRVNGKPFGAPDRSVSYPANTWEYPPRKRSSNYTYYIPLTADMKGAKIDAVVLGMRNGTDKFKPEVWITTYPTPFAEQLLELAP